MSKIASDATVGKLFSALISLFFVIKQDKLLHVSNQ